jgi:hypothetical protein
MLVATPLHRLPQMPRRGAATRHGTAVLHWRCRFPAVRVPDTSLHSHGKLWLLTQGETRETKRVRLLTEFFISQARRDAPLFSRLPLSRA